MPQFYKPRLVGVAVLAAIYIAYNVDGPTRTELPDGVILNFAADHPLLFAVVTKIAPILALAYQTHALSGLAAADAQTRSYGRTVSAGLAISSVGDALLDWHGLRLSAATAEGKAEAAEEAKLLFLGGIGSFLVAQLSYTAAFRRKAGGHNAIAAAAVAVYVIVFSLPLLAPGAACTVGLPALLSSVPSDLTLPVVLYATAVGAMVYSALTVRNDADAASKRLAALGAITFAVSDSILALGEFGSHGVKSGIAHPKLAVMLTYYAAQVLIASSVRVEVPAAASAAATPASASATRKGSKSD